MTTQTAATKITRAWAMPNADTFSIKPIKELISGYFARANIAACDPFVRNSPFKDLCVSNDLDTDVVADYHLDALDFLRQQADNAFDLMLFDPPYSPRQVSEVYNRLGRSVNMQTTQASFWGDIKKEIARVTKGHVITFGWNSGGVGKKYGFEIEKILMVAHGSWHNDTICTVEIKQGDR